LLKIEKEERSAEGALFSFSLSWLEFYALQHFIGENGIRN